MHFYFVDFANKMTILVKNIKIDEEMIIKKKNWKIIIFDNILYFILQKI